MRSVRCPNHFYKRLSSSLEEVQQLLSRVSGMEDRASLGVLEEDLRALLEECEEFLLLPREEVTRRGIASFFSRSETVLEEAEDIVQSLKGDSRSRLQPKVTAADSAFLCS